MEVTSSGRTFQYDCGNLTVTKRDDRNPKGLAGRLILVLTNFPSA